MDILLCDDDPAVAYFMQTRLEIEGWRVQLTTNGEECLAVLESGERPDVLILDQEMPGLKGTEVASRVRDDGFTNPIVLCSAHLGRQVNRERKRLDLLPVSKIDMEAVVRLVSSADQDARLSRTGVTKATPPRPAQSLVEASA